MAPKHILKTFNLKANDFDEDQVILDCFNWLVIEFSGQNCLRPWGYSHHKMNCKCVHFLGDDHHAPASMKAAEFMVHYRKMTPVCQKIVLNEWAKISCVLEEC
eukprot:3296060-Ditylum_brightwellii.AAC.1